jgi:transglutaminase-like putative cysteine protease
MTLAKADDMQITKGRYWHFFDNLAVEGSAELRLWVALPPNHRGQQVTILNIYPRPEEIIEDKLSGNRIIFWRITDFTNPAQLYCYYDFQFGRETVFTNIDPEKIGPYGQDSEEYRRYTISEPWIEITDEIRTRAVKIAEGETNPYIQSLRIFDWILANMDYEYPDPANRGAANSFTSLKGDCGEFSFVFCAMCRSLGIPARTITCMWLTEAGHNWAEILLPGYGWVPVDLSVAQALAGKSKAFPDEKSTRAFAESRGILEYDPYWLYGNLYPERLIISVGNNLEVKHPELGIAKTFRFLQPGGVNAIPPAFEASGFAAQPVEAGFFLFGDESDDNERAKQEALKKMSQGYLTAGNYEMAEKGLQKKLEEKPDNAHALLDLGQCYLNQGRFDEAIEAFQGSLAGKGGSAKPVMDVWVHNLLGLCHKSKGEIDKARQEFQGVIESGIDFQNSQQFARDQLQGCE